MNSMNETRGKDNRQAILAETSGVCQDSCRLFLFGLW